MIFNYELYKTDREIFILSVSDFPLALYKLMDENPNRCLKFKHNNDIINIHIPHDDFTEKEIDYVARYCASRCENLNRLARDYNKRENARSFMGSSKATTDNPKKRKTKRMLT